MPRNDQEALRVARELCEIGFDLQIPVGALESYEVHKKVDELFVELRAALGLARPDYERPLVAVPDPPKGHGSQIGRVLNARPGELGLKLVCTSCGGHWNSQTTSCDDCGGQTAKVAAMREP